MINTFDQNFETVLVIIAYDIPNKREYFSLSFDRSVVVIIFNVIFFKFKIDSFSLLFFEHGYFF